MKNATMILAMFVSAAAMSAAVPKVTRATFSQAGLRTVTINYTIADAPAIVTVDIQTNGISIGAQNFWNVEGDVNCRVEPGEHVITWRPHESWPSNYVPLTENGGARAVVTAWALDNPPDYIVADLGKVGALRYYTSTNAFPGGLLDNPVYRTSYLVMKKIKAKGIPWTMGTGSGAHVVTLTNDFYMSVFEVTQGQWWTVKGDSDNKTKFSYPGDRFMRPVDWVTYDDVRGKENPWPNVTLADSLAGIIRTRTGLDVDLPGESHWEYAARGGNVEGKWGNGVSYGGDEQDGSLPGRYRYNGGNDGDDYSTKITAETANQYSAEKGTALVGSYSPNSFGLYDMNGNVWEMCLDFHTSGLAALEGRLNINADGSASYDEQETVLRVLRGGCISSSAKECRPTSRARTLRAMVSGFPTGVRLVCPIPGN